MFTNHEEMRILDVKIQAHNRRLGHADPLGERGILQREQAHRARRHRVIERHCEPSLHQYIYRHTQSQYTEALTGAKGNGE